MHYVTVEVDLDQFDDDDLIEEITYRGYKVIKSADDRNTIYPVDKLYSHYMTCSPETFNEELKKFFMDNIENIYLK